MTVTDKTVATTEEQTTIVESSIAETQDGPQIAKALTVEEIDTDLYRSNELWHPPGSRGAFGGQVSAI